MRSARQIVVTGRVQGVGYRPFVYVTAHDLGITGSVLNGSGKVLIHAEGPSDALDALETALINAAPPLARPTLAESSQAEVTGANSFEILASNQSGEAEIHVPPDLYTCDDCVQELTTPGERRHGYPFINCTQCGPRYTIITAMPYDRPNTSMKEFPLCEDCRQEYESPLDRRFHAQPLACPECGPTLTFKEGHPAHDKPNSHVGGRHAGDLLSTPNSIVGGRHAGDLLSNPNSHVGGRHAGDPIPPTKIQETQAPPSLQQAVKALHKGSIVAVKGVGGYHLICDAANDSAITRLRTRKHRPDKPLAVMFPITGADGLASVKQHLDLDEVTTGAILDSSRPIVLIPKRQDFSLGQGLAPGLRELGAFLPYSPLHHLLLNEFGGPVVATSGNISGEPVITHEQEAEKRLAQVADAFLHHNRPIVRPADDPVVRPISGRPRAIRLGRGTAPVERSLPFKIEKPLLATGGHLKVTVALAWDKRIVVSPHVGELDSRRSLEVFKQNIIDIQSLYDVKTQAIVCDSHPGYASTRWAESQDLPIIRVQHHTAHASALAGEHPEVENWLVFTWDGVGYGTDGSLWGGEAFTGGPGRWFRKASFKPFKLVGGDLAGRQPWRSAAALLWAASPDGVNNAREFFLQPGSDVPAPDTQTLAIARKAWQKNMNTHSTSAVGRLFDAAASLVLERNMSSFEGQGPMELEQVASQNFTPVSLPLEDDGHGVLRSDWTPLLPFLMDKSVTQADRAAMFHASMARALVDQAVEISKTNRIGAVGLSGGVFQNRLLTELAVAGLEEQGIEVRLHNEVPANDGGLSFGQIVEAAAQLHCRRSLSTITYEQGSVPHSNQPEKGAL